MFVCNSSHSFVSIFSTGAIHFGINCFGVCGDADGNGDPNGASNELTSAGGSDNPDFKLSESFCLGMDLGGGAITGTELQLLTDTELQERARNTNIFARLRPETANRIDVYFNPSM